MSRIRTQIEREILYNSDMNFNALELFNITQLVQTHITLTFEYNILIAYLSTTNESPDSKHALLLLLTAHKLATLLSILYEKYLVVPREALRLRNDEIVIRERLLRSNYSLPDPWEKKDAPPKADKFSQTIRTEHAMLNWYRLLLVRVKRLLGALRPFLLALKPYANVMDAIDKFTNPIFAQLSWGFFAPRLVTNLSIVFKHCIPGFGMTQEEKNIPFTSRLNATWKRHWFELGNDSVWLVSGLLNCLVLTGALTPIAVYLTMVLYWYDVLLSAIRTHLELNRLLQLQSEYEFEQKPQALQIQLQHQVDFEKRRLAISLGANLGLAFAVLYTLPAMILFSPVFPLTAAALLVAITIISYSLNKINDKTKPKSFTGALANHGLFKMPPPHKSIAAETTQSDLASSPREGYTALNSI